MLRVTKAKVFLDVCLGGRFFHVLVTTVTYTLTNKILWTYLLQSRPSQRTPPGANDPKWAKDVEQTSLEVG